jgi:hypothetical protein
MSIKLIIKKNKDMKKVLFILISVLFSVYSYSQQFDTLFPQITTVYNPLDTITYTYIIPEIMDESLCYDNGHYDNLLGFPDGLDLSRLHCEGNPIKAVAQGFLFENTTTVEGVYALMGLSWGVDGQTLPVGFKTGVMDSSYNVIYEKEYILDPPMEWGLGLWFEFVFVPYDSVLHLNDFVYIFMEWPDSTCVGGQIITEYTDDHIKMGLAGFTEIKSAGQWTEEVCIACGVKYDPLFKWYGDNYWVEKSSLTCALDRYAYAIVKENNTVTMHSCPPIGVAFYYNNYLYNNNDDSGNDDDSENNDDDSGLSDLDISYLVRLQPNPAKDIVTVQSSFKVKEIEIHNVLGQVVLRKEGSQNIETIDVSNLQSGTYIVRIKTQRGFANKKILIE